VQGVVKSLAGTMASPAFAPDRTVELRA